MSLRLLQYSDIENAYDDSERIGRLAGLIEELRDETTLVIGIVTILASRRYGDNTAPGALAMVTEAEQALAFFQAVEPDAETFGNHELVTLAMTYVRSDGKKTDAVERIMAD